MSIQQPEPTEPVWKRQGTEKASGVNDLFAQIAPTYDRLNDIMTLRQAHAWRAKAVQKLGLEPGDWVLDLCCGTGDFLPHLRRAVGSSGHVLAMDFCLPMLELSGPKDAEALLGVADATHIPLADESVNAVTVGWGIRNVPNIDRTHQEIFRVLKPGGTFISLDMAIPKNGLVRWGSRSFQRLILPQLGKMVQSKGAYQYLVESTELFQSREALADSMQRAGFQSVQFQDLFFGNICMHWGKKH